MLVTVELPDDLVIAARWVEKGDCRPEDSWCAAPVHRIEMPVDHRARGGADRTEAPNIRAGRYLPARMRSASVTAWRLLPGKPRRTASITAAFVSGPATKRCGACAKCADNSACAAAQSCLASASRTLASPASIASARRRCSRRQTGVMKPVVTRSINACPRLFARQRISVASMRASRRTPPRIMRLSSAAPRRWRLSLRSRRDRHRAIGRARCPMCTSDRKQTPRATG